MVNVEVLVIQKLDDELGQHLHIKDELFWHAFKAQRAFGQKAFLVSGMPRNSHLQDLHVLVVLNKYFVYVQLPDRNAQAVEMQDPSNYLVYELQHLKASRRTLHIFLAIS